MLAGIPGPGFVIFRAGRVIEVPRKPLKSIGAAAAIGVEVPVSGPRK